MPNIHPQAISALVSYMQQGKCDIGTLASEFSSKDEIQNPNVVKVATNLTALGSESPALYFSRSPIPYGKGNYYEQIGLYMYKRHALEKFILSSQTILEERERIENERSIRF